jgi:hypothetical protein
VLVPVLLTVGYVTERERICAVWRWRCIASEASYGGAAGDGGVQGRRFVMLVIFVGLTMFF